MKTKLLSIGVDAKTSKGEKKGYLTAILYLAPHTLGGGKTLCPFSTEGCRAVCLYSAGHGAFNSVQQARIRKTKWWNTDPQGFLTQLRLDIVELERQAKARGLIPVVRLNGTSDIMWSKTGIMRDFPHLQFYGYTKWPASKYPPLEPNEHITYSFSEKPDAPLQVWNWMKRGVNTAVVFNKTLPDTWAVPIKEGVHKTLLVINGDETDLRFTDPKGVIVGLKTKGYARKAETGPGHFVQEGRAAA